MEINLNGNNITGTLNYAFAGAGVSKLSGNGTVNQVDVNTPLASFNQGAGVTITTLNLINVAPATYTNNGTITTANITDTDARFLNQGTATVSTLNVNTTGFVTLGGNAPITQVVVANAGSVDIAPGTTVTGLVVNGSTTVNNAGVITDLVANEDVIVTGTPVENEPTGNGNVSADEDELLGKQALTAFLKTASNFEYSVENGIPTVGNYKDLSTLTISGLNVTIDISLNCNIKLAT